MASVDVIILLVLPTAQRTVLLTVVDILISADVSFSVVYSIFLKGLIGFLIHAIFKKQLQLSANCHFTSFYTVL